MEDYIKKESVDSKDVIPYILGNYERASENGIADAEHQLMLVEPFSSDRGILYALRVSLCVPKLTNLATLASRYNTACLGAGNMGLSTSKESLYYQEAYDFLTDRYLCRFAELADKVYQEAKKTAGKRVNKEAKVKVLYAAQEKIVNSMKLIKHILIGIDAVVDGFKKQISEEIYKIDEDNQKLLPNNDKRLELYKVNSDVVNGYKFCATMQLRTPLEYLEMHGQVLDLKSEPPQVLQAHGVWLPVLKSWAELGINLKEAPEGTMASDIGPIPANGGAYLEFLKAFRKIVESKKSIEEQTEEISFLPKQNPEFAKFLSKHRCLQPNMLHKYLYELNNK